MYVYFILDKTSNAIKIGKSNNIEDRLSHLQIGNPNELTVIHYIKCDNDNHSFLVESKFHSLHADRHIRGEWFAYDADIFTKSVIDAELYKRKQTRDSLTIQTLFGEETKFETNKMPNCYFYPNLKAQILDSYEKSAKKRIPFRTMVFPTNGKCLLLPFSPKKDLVFISTKKHQENNELKKFLKNNDSEPITLNRFFE